MTRSRRPDGEGRLLQLVYYGYVGASAVVRWLPERVVYFLAQSLGSIAARLSKRRPVVEANLARITGLDRDSQRVQELVVESFRSYARYWLETFRLVREDRAFFLERFKGIGADNIDAALAQGRGVIVVVGHLGNWDAAGAWVGARGNRLVTVAEVLRPRRMFDFFRDHRARLGMTIFPAEKGATERLAEAVESGAVVAILGDRDLKGTGPEVTFFGERVTFPAGPASVLFRTKAPLLVAGVYGVRLDDGRYGWEAHISEPLDVPTERSEEAIVQVTQTVATEMEALVARRPEEWHVMQPFWPADKKR
ncbi:MAG: phosphatidylinositol mannoside acyltransferase [Actinobacteria bacterium]|nr:phosphatidylinositol mannoside acyltransferase [Actinomycetota bacterium]